jgi:Flp pilus assembly protein TadD
LIRVRPQAHQGTYLKPLLKTSEFCASCHQQSYSVAQNGYRTLPTDTTASEWLSSPFAPHTLGIPHNGGAKTCQECHFQTHASPASNATLASLRGDTEHLNATQKSLQSSRLQLDIFAPSPPAGQPVRLDIVVHNSSIGHDFPSGYTDIKDIWLEVLVKESTGRVLFESRGEKGEPTHRWGHIGLDRSGGRILRNNRSDEITSLQHRTIKAGESDIARYTFSLPKGERREYSVTARLLHRSHRPEFVQWVLPQKRLSLPITLLAETTATLFAPNTIPPQDLAKRYIRYGNALLTPKEPDLQGAIRAFRTAQTLFPQNVEGSLGLADAYLREPALLSARNQFVQVLREKPNHKGAIFGLGKVLGRQGQFQQALQQLLPLATEAHSDLRLWSEIGVISYQQGDYTSSVHALQKALSLQPQDPKLHYQLKQSFQRLQQVAEARREETILKFLTERRWETTILTEYLRLNPADKTLQRGIPEYVLLPMKQGNVPTKSK